MSIKFLAPRGPCICEEDIDMIRRLRDLFDQSFDTTYLRAIRWY